MFKDNCKVAEQHEKKHPDKYERFPLFAIICLSLAACCALIYFICTTSERFADFFNIYIAGAFRFLFAQLTNLFPFSLQRLQFSSLQFGSGF